MILRAEDKLVDFKCSFGDLLCASYEQQANWAADATNWLAGVALGGQGFSPESSLWTAATGEAGQWLGMAIIVMAITFTVGIAGGSLMQRPDTIKRTLLATFASLPAFYFSYFFIGEGLKAIDDFSDGILARLTGAEGFGQMIESLFQAEASYGSGMALVAPPIGRMLVTIVIMAIAMLFIAVAMAFRDFVLMILIAFGPLAFALMPARGAKDEWFRRWLSAVAAMALARPLILGTVALVMAGFRDTETIWSSAGLSLAIGFVISAFMPVLAYGFFQWMGAGGGGDDIGQRAAGQSSQKTQQVISSVTRRIPKGGGGGRGAAPSAAPRQSANSNGSSKTPKGDGGGGKSAQSRPGEGPASTGRLEGGKPGKTGKPSTPSQGTREAPATPKPSSTPKPPPRPSERPAPQVPREPRR
ncbi:MULTISPECIES: hypothetical protein [unclassified Leucobacter]|uniref:hypothetical protein n=1 Tax=unclassified Leucobacter TaxID=2621730 RepID=UPI003019013E